MPVHFTWSADDELRATVGLPAADPSLEDRLAFGFLILEGERL